MGSSNQKSNDFMQEAAGTSRPGVLAEFKAFLTQNKKWWLGPILLVFLLLGLIAIGGGQAAAPFIYTLF